MTNETTTTAPTTTSEGSAVSTAAATPATASAAPAAGEATAAATTTNPAEGEAGKTGETSKGETEPAKTGAPEKYEFKVPEGSAWNEDGLTALSEFAKENNLNQEAAQGLMDKVIPALSKQGQVQAQKMTAEWEQQARSDKEFGGEKIEENLAVAKKAIDKFATPELMALLRPDTGKPGLGSHPELVRLFYRIGKSISDDTIVNTNTAAHVPKSSNPLDLASALYPNLPSH